MLKKVKFEEINWTTFDLLPNLSFNMHLEKNVKIL